VAEAVRRLWAGDALPPLLSSFRPDALQGAREGAPELARALLVDTPWDGWFEMARSLDCAAVITNHDWMDAAVIERLHAAGLRALCYTVNDPQRARQLLGLGIDGLITDAVDVFAPGAGRQA
jgi:glycerophosphoryl diester phosphodiesterase